MSVELLQAARQPQPLFVPAGPIDRASRHPAGGTRRLGQPMKASLVQSGDPFAHSRPWPAPEGPEVGGSRQADGPAARWRA
jgi:hypothetical protein